MENSIVVMLGGLITAGAGLVLDKKREQRRIRQIRKALSSGVRNDLARALVLYDRLIDQWQASGTVNAQSLQALGHASPTYYGNSEWLSLFDELGCSRAVFDYHSDSTRLLSRIERDYADLQGASNDQSAEIDQARARLAEAMTDLVKARQRAEELWRLLSPGDKVQAA